MKTLLFEPTINGQSVLDQDGNPVQVFIEVPADVENIDFNTSIDGVPIQDKYLLPNTVYDILKWVGLLFLPTLAWVYTMLAGAWSLPYAEEVPFTLNIFGTMIAVLIGASSINNIVR